MDLPLRQSPSFLRTSSDTGLLLLHSDPIYLLTVEVPSKLLQTTVLFYAIYLNPVSVLSAAPNIDLRKKVCRSIQELVG